MPSGTSDSLTRIACDRAHLKSPFSVGTLDRASRFSEACDPVAALRRIVVLVPIVVVRASFARDRFVACVTRLLARFVGAGAVFADDYATIALCLGHPVTVFFRLAVLVPRDVVGTSRVRACRARMGAVFKAVCAGG